MRICLLIPDGVGIRNYLYSDLIRILDEKGHQVILWHSLDPAMIEITEARTGVHFEQFTFIHKPNGILVQLLREAGRYARIRLNADQMQNPTILTNWSGAASSTKGKLLNVFAEWLGKRVRSYHAVGDIESRGFRLIHSSAEFSEARKTLELMRPDVLFCSHQRVFAVTPAIEAAKSMGIPTSTAIFSWDNLPKGRLPFRVDQYMVWSQYMRNELLAYYPEVPTDSIQITGAPQFDFYFQKDLLLDRVEFARKYELDLGKQWVCFSGCDSITSPNDPQYLIDVAEALAGESEIQLIFRPVPVEPINRFSKALEQHQDIKVLEPKWVKGSHWGSFFPLFEDIQLLVNLAYHCPVVLNMGSTMALDFSAFGNVGLYLNYDHENGKPGWSVDTIYQYQHFRSMGDWKAVGYIFSKEEILPQVKLALEAPDQVAPDRQLWYSKIVEPNPGRSSADRIAEALLSLAHSSK